MNTSIEIYLGAPIEIESEQVFLSTLCADLKAMGQSGLIFANFLLPPRRPVHQIDFLVILDHIACHVELKNLTAPVEGIANGPWHLCLPDGTKRPLDGKNPYRQALDCKFAVSDEMHKFARRFASVSNPPNGSKFYSLIESVVCVYPDLLSASSVPNNHKVRVFGYPDFLKFITETTRNPGWSKENWISFAMELGLVRQEQAMTSAEIATAKDEELIEDYLRRFRDYYEKSIPPLIPTTIETGDSRTKSSKYLNLFSNGAHIQLVGPAGSGKSHHAIHMTLNSIDAGRIPIVSRAIEYSGRLSNLLNRSIAHLCPRSAMQFIEAVSRVGRPVTLVIDGFNECPTKLKQNLIRDMQAFYLRWQIPIVFTTQNEIPLPENLSGQVFRFCDLDQNERFTILTTYATEELPEHVQELCDPFRSAYELSLAASCISEITPHPTRVNLFEAFIRRRCGDTVDIAIVRRVLSAIADLMRTGLRSSLPVSEVWRIAEKLLDDQQVPLTTLQEIMSCDLLDVQQGQCTFRHELLQRFFESIALLRVVNNPIELAKELKKPAHHTLIEFALGMQSEPETFRLCLESAAKTGVSSDLISRCLLGQFGELGRQVAMADAKEMFAKAEQELEKIDIPLKQDPHKQHPFLVEITNGREWSSYDCGLMNAIAHSLARGLFFDEVLELLAQTEHRCTEILTDKFGADQVSKQLFQSSLFFQLFVLGQGKLPATSILRVVDGNLLSDLAPCVVDRISRLVENPDDLSIAENYLILCILGAIAGPIERSIPGLLRHCWNSRVYHLQLKILDRVGLWGGRPWLESQMSTATREEIIEILGGLQTSNIFLSTQLVETMMAYDMIESPVSSCDIGRQLEDILARPSDDEAQQAASVAVSNIFEDVFQGAYYNSIEALSPHDRTKLFTMAGLADPSDAFYSDFILSELLKQYDANSLSVFERFATELDGESICSQVTTKSFILAHVGCAQYVNSPMQLTNLKDGDRRAWQFYGEIIFWASKPDLSKKEVNERCNPIWKILETGLAFEAVDPLMRFVHSSGMTKLRDHEDPVQILFSTFRDEIRRILEFGLKNRHHLSSIDERLPADVLERQRTTFMIHTLGQIGGPETANQLVSFIEDDYHGQDAVEAIRKLNSKESFERLSVLHRFP